LAKLNGAAIMKLRSGKVVFNSNEREILAKEVHDLLHKIIRVACKDPIGL
jgi:hypothetical protein